MVQAPRRGTPFKNHCHKENHWNGKFNSRIPALTFGATATVRRSLLVWEPMAHAYSKGLKRFWKTHKKTNIWLQEISEVFRRLAALPHLGHKIGFFPLSHNFPKIQAAQVRENSEQNKYNLKYYYYYDLRCCHSFWCGSAFSLCHYWVSKIARNGELSPVNYLTAISDQISRSLRTVFTIEKPGYREVDGHSTWPTWDGYVKFWPYWESKPNFQVHTVSFCRLNQQKAVK